MASSALVRSSFKMIPWKNQIIRTVFSYEKQRFLQVWNFLTVPVPCTIPITQVWSSMDINIKYKYSQGILLRSTSRSRASKAASSRGSAALVCAEKHKAMSRREQMSVCQCIRTCQRIAWQLPPVGREKLPWSISVSTSDSGGIPSRSCLLGSKHAPSAFSAGRNKTSKYLGSSKFPPTLHVWGFCVETKQIS